MNPLPPSTNRGFIRNLFWTWPRPLPEAKYFDVSDPALFRRKLWPKKVEPDDLDILIAGCGANQAAYYAFTNPESRVVGIDISGASLAHEKYPQAEA